jgi:hypothetical protein
MDEFKMRASDVIRIIKQLQENKMMDIDKLIGRMVQLEKELLDLRLEHNELLEAYKKDVDEAYRSGYRDGSESPKDSSGNH